MAAAEREEAADTRAAPEVTPEAAARRLEALRRSNPGDYTELLMWFRAKRTQLEMVRDRGYGSTPREGDGLELRDDFGWLYYSREDGVLLGCDAEWEREVLPRFYSHFASRARELTRLIRALPRPPPGWGRPVSPIEAMSNVYYSPQRDCYLYVRFSDLAGLGEEDLKGFREERRRPAPISHPGFGIREGGFAPTICHQICVFGESERGSSALKRIAEAEEIRFTPPAIFFCRDLAFNPTQHYLNPEFALALGAATGCVASWRGQEPRRSTIPAAKAGRREGPESEAEDAATAAGVPKCNLPLVRVGDPVVSYFGAGSGDILAMTNFPRYNTFVPVVRSYRRVVASS